MAANIRTSKFKHIYGQPLKKEESFDDVLVSKSALDTSFCDVNPKFIALILECSGGGSFLILPIEKYGRHSPNVPVANGHSKAVTDLRWCPHDDNIIASASDDCTIKIWNVEEPGPDAKDANLTFSELATLTHHERRVNLILWHPSVKNVLLTAGNDNLLTLCNLETTEIIAQQTFEKPVCSASFNFDGSKLVIGLKDGHVAILNAKNLEILQIEKCHDSTKPCQVAYLRGEKIFTTGFGRGGKRLYALCDAKELTKMYTSEEIDNNNGVMFIQYDSDLNLLFLVGKGDSVVRYFEYDEQEANIFYLNRFDSQEPQRGFAFMGKRGVNVQACEITRLYKVHAKKVEVIPFVVPRKSEHFQKDLYPDTPGLEPALTVAEWLDGKDSTPILVSFRIDLPRTSACLDKSALFKFISLMIQLIETCAWIPLFVFTLCRDVMMLLFL
ncbi:Coronin-6 [Cichlidogyrus casuarinus]|uniref:Coronin n=1 Tax=Cichlidogyrus casuarinus TaxID=1844966 RepID=A0ABD2Q5D6_9PLAT